MSNDLLKKIKFLKNSVPDDINIWLYDMIINGDSLIKIAKEYIDRDTEYTDSFSSSSSGLFYAYICYKNSMEFDYNEKQYLSNRAGMLSYYKIPQEEITEQHKNFDFITVKDVINYYENNHFFNWLIE